ncbi:formin-like protein 5 [Hordeum vulgare subsp. vulgare]|uniref:formin-like protein 5 n=1 Tax=Hordeum vulgare subsp. vulgare TaxID=112509 RepID=UPI001D1A50A8|nr:formin-like protein 5 [Hordeum vulgare subsp. vulgare]
MVRPPPHPPTPAPAPPARTTPRPPRPPRRRRTQPRRKPRHAAYPKRASPPPLSLTPHPNPKDSNFSNLASRHRKPLAGRHPTPPLTTPSRVQAANKHRSRPRPPPPAACRVEGSEEGEDGEAPVPDRADHALQLRPPLRLRPLPRLLPPNPRRRQIQQPQGLRAHLPGVRGFLQAPPLPAHPVCEKVEAKGRTTYNEVADEIYSELKSMAHIGQGFDEKNIRRGVYDAFNVLIALRVIAKEKKEIRWMGLSNYRYEKLKKLEEVRKELVNKIRHKKALLQEIEKQFDDLQNIKLHNETLQSSAENVNGIRLPFVLVKVFFSCAATVGDA